MDFYIAIFVMAAVQLLGAFAAAQFVDAYKSNRRLIITIEAGLMLLISGELLLFGMTDPISTAAGFALGFAAIMSLGMFIGPEKHTAHELKLFFAMCLHEIPEGFAVGAAFVLSAAVPHLLSSPAALLTAALVALHNFPEGAIVMTPLALDGKKELGYLVSLTTQFAFMAAAIAAFLFIGPLPAFLQNGLTAMASGAMAFIAMEELMD